MAIKVTKQGTIKKYKATCPICGCEFEFDTTDASWSQRELIGTESYAGVKIPRTEILCRITCPSCHTWIDNKQKGVL